jgi:hypothetical protein
LVVDAFQARVVVLVERMMRAIRMGWYNYHTAAVLLTLVGMSGLTGCGDGKIARYPVKGTVLVDGKPAEGAMLIFVPVDGTEEFQRERPFDDSTDSAGQFELRTFEPGDGAPAGEYRVMIRWLATNSQPGATPGGQADGQPVFDRLKNKYFSVESPITATVEEEDNVLEPFALSSK